MKALRIKAGHVNVEDVALPNRSGEALVRVIKSGICNTDLEIVRGYANFNGTIGHEFVGIVEAAPHAPGLLGARVVGEINAGCGKCELCIGGDPRHCADRTVLGIHNRDGAHAELLNLPSHNLIRVPEEVSDNAAVFAEPLAAAYGISERVDIGPETRVAVIGDGKLGLLCAMALRLKTDDISIVGRHRSKLSIAENVGIK